VCYLHIHIPYIHTVYVYVYIYIYIHFIYIYIYICVCILSVLSVLEKSRLPRVNWTTYIFQSAGIFPRSHAHAKGHANADVKASERRTALAYTRTRIPPRLFLASNLKNRPGTLGEKSSISYAGYCAKKILRSRISMSEREFEFVIDHRENASHLEFAWTR